MDGWMDGWAGGQVDSTRTRKLFSVWGKTYDSKMPLMWWRAIGRGRDPKGQGPCDQIQHQEFWYLGTNGTQPGMAPSGQGEV